MRLNRLPLLVLMLVLALAAIGTVTVLEGQTDGSRQAQLRVGAMTVALTDLRVALLHAGPGAVGSPAPAEMEAYERVLSRGLSPASGVKASPSALAVAHRSLESIDSAVGSIDRIAKSPAGLYASKQASELQRKLAAPFRRLLDVLDFASHADAARANGTRRAAIGLAVAMLALAAAFLFFHLRLLGARAAAELLARHNEELLAASRMEASTDSLTGLGNRRALTDDLERAIASTEDDLEPLLAIASTEDDLEPLLAIFDLNGFKQYNDTFGHGAGDSLLARLGGRLATAVDGAGSAYRLGGDEFCVLARCTPQNAEALLAGGASALSDSAAGWSIDCSYGAVWTSSEACSASEALGIADQRMYASKATRSSASRQITDVLLQVLAEQNKGMDAHVSHVAELSGRLATALDQPDHEVQRIHLAAQLHDVGNTAIPAAILNKPGPLAQREWEFVSRHTVAGERIVLAAPALAHTAPLVRSSHEHVDGAGYPDGLVGEQIPVGARIIAVCDAFDAMTSSRPYRDALSIEEALDELRGCAGSQFDPPVVAAFCELDSWGRSMPDQRSLSRSAICAAP
jgi:diguanylate cyclase (GGDEF)-like protein